MTVDPETFTELTVHLKVASDALLRTARHLALLASNDEPAAEERCAGALDDLMAMAIELAAMERGLRALMLANDAEGTPATRTKKLQSQP